MIKRLHSIFLVIALAILAFWVVEQNFFSHYTTDQIKLLTGLFTLIGLIFVALQLDFTWKNERIKTEYLNQPDFLITGFGEESFGGVYPVLCGDTNHCNDDHWFNLFQMGNLSAINLRMALFHSEEISSFDPNDSLRWKKELRLSRGEETEYKISQYLIPLKYLDLTKDRDCFKLLLEYTSEYSKIKYRRCYRLCYNPLEEQRPITDNDWKKRIKFYSSKIEHANDSESVTTNASLSLKIRLFFKKFGESKDKYKIEEWINDL